MHLRYTREAPSFLFRAADGTFQYVTVCVRAGCGRDTAALASFDREALAVRLRNIDTDAAFTIGLCEAHVARLTVPMGWTLADERFVSESVESTLPQPSGERAETSAETQRPRKPSSPEGGLLNRAFKGPDSDSPSKRRLSWLERDEQQVDGSPEGLRDGEEDQRQQGGHSEARTQDQRGVKIGSSENETQHHDQRERTEGDAGVDTDSADELPLLPLEDEPTTRARFSQAEPTLKNVALTTDRTPLRRAAREDPQRPDFFGARGLPAHGAQRNSFGQSRGFLPPQS